MSTPPSGDAGRKRPWLAALLAVIYPGLGHVYLRKWGRALAWFALVIAASTLLLPESAIPTTLSVDAFVDASRAISPAVSVTILGLTVLNVLDAYWLAARSTDRSPPIIGETGEGTLTCPNCGKELESDIDFCHWCTTRLEETDGSDGT